MYFSKPISSVRWSIEFDGKPFILSRPQRNCLHHLQSHSFTLSLPWALAPKNLWNIVGYKAFGIYQYNDRTVISINWLSRPDWKNRPRGGRNLYKLLWACATLVSILGIWDVTTVWLKSDRLLPFLLSFEMSKIIRRERLNSPPSFCAHHKQFSRICPNCLLANSPIIKSKLLVSFQYAHVLVWRIPFWRSGGIRTGKGPDQSYL